ncbi:wd repeat-containing protein 31 [Stylonychia lemnae]|uniref:Wd repeat-containing protein 31 n=1 Tax=Stylonychia lemnae TaxID=5949 RepID=A0A078AKV8_STYLE|nr:wd repeat-containing protein 31 [Stylonychia lemnae]|eukprot:CDW81448.1 wd repeat-containing protein 31 [Stylonychia lemnae]
MVFIERFYLDDVIERLFKNDQKNNRVKFSDFMRYLDEEQTYDYNKQEYKQSLELFDQDKNGKADIEDIKRVLKTYSSLNDAQVNHFITLNLMNDPNANDDYEKNYEGEGDENFTKGNPPNFTTNQDNFAGKDRPGRLEWENFGLLQPNFISYICPVLDTPDSNKFLICAEFLIHYFDVEQKTGAFNHIGSLKSHDKVVNMCTPVNEQLFISCSRDPIIKLYNYPSQDDNQIQPTALFEGHDMSVTSASVSPCKTRLISGSRDQTTRLWDLETQQQLQSRKIERNAITYLKFLPYTQDLFIECSEDLTLRLWDIRARPFKPSIEFKVGTNFATTCDVLSQDGCDKLLVTGHRGFNESGADVKLWDLREFGEDKLVWNYPHHKFNPESVRFVQHSDPSPVIITASKDQQMHLIDVEKGDQLDSIKHGDSFISMDILGNKGLFVAADVKSNLNLFSYDNSSRQIKYFE